MIGRMSRTFSPGCLASRIRPLRAALASRPNPKRQAELDALIAKRNEMVLANMGLVGIAIKKISARYIEKIGGMDDASGQGMLALIDAAELFDPTKGWRFSTYAVTCIWRRLMRDAPTMQIVRVTQKAWIRHLRDGLEALDQAEWPTTAWGQPVDIDWLEDDGPALVDQRLDMEVVWRAWGRLSSRERQLLRLRVLDGEKLEDVGRRFGFTKEAARQNQRKAIVKLRELLESMESPEERGKKP